MRTLCVILLALSWSLAIADDRADYNRRAAAADKAAFSQLDLNRDGTLSREEASSDLNLGPRFDDMDINRDGLVTREEFERYLDQTYGASRS
jgi:Ca2+-binding EF-hand superfamily protein